MILFDQLLLVLIFTCSLFNATRSVHPKSLKDAVFAQHPQLMMDYLAIGNQSEQQDELFAITLGMFLAHSKPNLFGITHDNEFTAICYLTFNLNKFIELVDTEFNSPQEGLTPEQVEKRKKLAAFCNQILDIDKLRKERGKRRRVKWSEGGADVIYSDITIQTAHTLFAQNGTSAYAVMAIDFAILRFCGNVQVLHSYMLDGPLLTSLLALQLFPKISAQLTHEFEVIWRLLEEEGMIMLSSISRHLTGFMALLPEGNAFRKRLEQVLPSKTKDPLKYTLNELSAFGRNEYYKHKDAGILEFFMNGCPENIFINYITNCIQLSDVHCYKTSILPDEAVVYFENVDASFLFVKLSEFTFKEVDSECFARDILVASLVPLDPELLDIIGRYVLGKPLETLEMRYMIYLQAAYGIFVVKGHQLTFNLI